MSQSFSVRIPEGHDVKCVFLPFCFQTTRVEEIAINAVGHNHSVSACEKVMEYSMFAYKWSILSDIVSLTDSKREK